MYNDSPCHTHKNDDKSQPMFIYSLVTSDKNGLIIYNIQDTEALNTQNAEQYCEMMQIEINVRIFKFHIDQK